MKRPPDARVIAMTRFGDFLVCLAADGTLWCAKMERFTDGNGYERLHSASPEGWNDVDGPFSYDPQGNEWTDDDADELTQGDRT